jgi:transposase-like protein
MHPEQEYPEKKQRELTDAEKAHLRERIDRGEDYAALAREFGCSTSQVAGIKAAMHRGVMD